MKNSPFEIIAPIAQTANTGARFASFTYRAKGSGEVASHTVALGVNIANAYKRDIAILKKQRAKLSGVALVACDELLASLAQSLEKGIGNNEGYTCADVYAPICAGVKVHKETGALHVYGFSIAKRVLESGAYKAVKSSEKTLAKKALQKRMKSGKFRQFAFESLESARMNGKVLEFR